MNKVLIKDQYRLWDALFDIIGYARRQKILFKCDDVNAMRSMAALMALFDSNAIGRVTDPDSWQRTVTVITDATNGEWSELFSSLCCAFGCDYSALDIHTIGPQHFERSILPSLRSKGSTEALAAVIEEGSPTILDGNWIFKSHGASDTDLSIETAATDFSTLFHSSPVCLFSHTYGGRRDFIMPMELFDAVCEINRAHCANAGPFASFYVRIQSSKTKRGRHPRRFKLALERSGRQGYVLTRSYGSRY